jgi:transposase
MRKSFEGLSGIIHRELDRRPDSGDVYVFINRRADRVKLLVWDRDGFWIHYKRLEKGRYYLPSGGEMSLEMRYEDLVMMLEGIDVSGIKKRLRYGR